MQLELVRAALLAALLSPGCFGAHAAEAPSCDSIVCTRSTGAPGAVAADLQASTARDLLRQAGSVNEPAGASRTQAERDWDAHMARTRDAQLQAINTSSVRPEQHEDYNCLLSVGFGGELKMGGYRAVRALGATRTLSTGTLSKGEVKAR
jgi:hypothetical protein